MIKQNKELNVILAATNKGEIGNKNTIPWKLKGDLGRFRSMTMGNVVIMGRHTYESFPGEIGDRTFIIVSSTMKRPTRENVFVARDFTQALKMANVFTGTIWIAGGVSLYVAALQFPCNIYLTTVYKDSPDGYDAVIPNFNVNNFEYEYPPIPIFDTDPATGLKHISHTYSKLYPKSLGALA